MKRTLGIVGIGLGLLGLVWIAVAWVVIPGFMMQAEESGRALSGLERLLFGAQRSTMRYWILIAPVALIAGVVGAGLVAGASSEPPPE